MMSTFLVILFLGVIAVGIGNAIRKQMRKAAVQTQGPVSKTPPWYKGYLPDDLEKKLKNLAIAIVGTIAVVSIFGWLYPVTAERYYNLGGIGYSFVLVVVAASIITAMDDKHHFRKVLITAIVLMAIVKVMYPLSTAIDEQQTAATTTQPRVASATTQIGTPVCNEQWECYVDVSETGTNPIPIVMSRYYCFPNEGPFQHLAERRGERPEWRDIETNIGQAVTIRFKLKPSVSGVQRLYYDMSAVPCRERGRRT